MSEQTSEAHEPTSRIVDWIAAHRRAASRPTIVGISGIDCAGKSTLAATLAARVQAAGWRATIASVDDYLFPRRIRNRNPDLVRGYLEDTFDTATLFDGLLVPARHAIALRVALRGLDWETDAAVTHSYDIDAETVLIVEGVFLFRRELPAVFDLKVWLELGFEAGLDRAVRRPRDLAHYPDRDAIRRRYLDRFYPAQRRHLVEDRPAERADFVFDVEVACTPS